MKAKNVIFGTALTSTLFLTACGTNEETAEESEGNNNESKQQESNEKEKL